METKAQLSSIFVSGLPKKWNACNGEYVSSLDDDGEACFLKAEGDHVLAQFTFDRNFDVWIFNFGVTVASGNQLSRRSDLFGDWSFFKVSKEKVGSEWLTSVAALPDTIYVYGMPMMLRGWMGAYDKCCPNNGTVQYELRKCSYWGISIIPTRFERSYDDRDWTFISCNIIPRCMLRNTNLFGTWPLYNFYVTAQKSWHI
jgi:hypothetical protein